MKRLALLLLVPALALGQERLAIPALDGKLELPGYWFGALADSPRPAVISLHGCGGLLEENGGLSRNRYRVAEYFNVERMHVLLVDSFTPRGLKSICETRLAQRSIDHEGRRADVYAAIRWLARRPDVDRGRIAVLGYSNGGGTVLSVVDRSDPLVHAQPLQPRAAVAFYPPCMRYHQRPGYEIGVPLLLMIGARDDWTRPEHCERLHATARRGPGDTRFDLVVYPDSHHGFDGYGPVQVRTGLPTKSGEARVGSNPQARDKALRRMFEFLSETLDVPLSLSHDARFAGHRYAVPPPSGFARADDPTAVPVSEKGRARYAQYLKLGAPKALAVTEKGGWFWRADDPEAMRVVLERCARAGARCWLYAVDDRVVWDRDPGRRIGASALQRSAPLTRAASLPALH